MTHGRENVVCACKVVRNYHAAAAVAISWLAQLLTHTNRLGEAEPLTRHALAIDEESSGPDVRTRTASPADGCAFWVTRRLIRSPRGDVR